MGILIILAIVLIGYLIAGSLGAAIGLVVGLIVFGGIVWALTPPAPRYPPRPRKRRF